MSLTHTRRRRTLAVPYAAPPPPPDVAEVVLTPASLTLQPGQSQQVTAQSYDPQAVPVPDTHGWQSQDTGIVTVDSNGNVVAASGAVVGTYLGVVRAYSGLTPSVYGEMDLTVQEAPPVVGWKANEPAGFTFLGHMPFVNRSSGTQPGGYGTWEFGTGGERTRVRESHAPVPSSWPFPETVFEGTYRGWCHGSGGNGVYTRVDGGRFAVAALDGLDDIRVGAETHFLHGAGLAMATVTSGSSLVTSDTPVFSPVHVGKPITVRGALSSTVQAYISPTQVHAANNATASASSRQFYVTILTTIPTGVSADGTQLFFPGDATGATTILGHPGASGLSNIQLNFHNQNYPTGPGGAMQPFGDASALYISYGIRRKGSPGSPNVLTRVSLGIKHFFLACGRGPNTNGELYFNSAVYLADPLANAYTSPIFQKANNVGLAPRERLVCKSQTVVPSKDKAQPMSTEAEREKFLQTYQWTRIEHLVQISSVDQEDGLWRVWRNGEMVLDWDNHKNRTAANQRGITFFKWNPTSNSDLDAPLPFDASWELSDIYVSGVKL